MLNFILSVEHRSIEFVQPFKILPTHVMEYYSLEHGDDWTGDVRARIIEILNRLNELGSLVYYSNDPGSATYYPHDHRRRKYIETYLDDGWGDWWD